MTDFIIKITLIFSIVGLIIIILRKIPVLANLPVSLTNRELKNSKEERNKKTFPEKKIEDKENEDYWEKIKKS